MITQSKQKGAWGAGGFEGSGMVGIYSGVEKIIEGLSPVLADKICAAHNATLAQPEEGQTEKDFGKPDAPSDHVETVLQKALIDILSVKLSDHANFFECFSMCRDIARTAIMKLERLHPSLTSVPGANVAGAAQVIPKSVPTPLEAAEERKRANELLLCEASENCAKDLAQDGLANATDITTIAKRIKTYMRTACYAFRRKESHAAEERKWREIAAKWESQLWQSHQPMTHGEIIFAAIKEAFAAAAQPEQPK